MGACIWTTFQLVSSTVFPSLFLSLILPVLSLHVVLGSNCTAVCTEYFLYPNTTVDEISCHDNEYNNTSVGRRFKDCISCELQSQTFDHGTNQTDLGWALFNIRYTLSWCIFGVPGFSDHSSISPCSETCRNISVAMETNTLNATASSPYDYCDELNSPADLSACASCYSPIKTQHYFSNYLNLLRLACEFKIPIPTPFPLLGSQIFTNTPPDNSSSSPNSTSNGLSQQAKFAIGIAIPSTLLLLVILAIIIWFIRGYKRKRSSSVSDQIPKFPSPPTRPLPLYKPFPRPPPMMNQNRPSPYYPPGPPPTIFHPTPRLRDLSASSPVPNSLQSHQPQPHITSQITFTHPIHHQLAIPTTDDTSVITGPLSPLPPPTPQSAMRSSPRTAATVEGSRQF